ncbi:MAG: hypothetical protein AAFW66_05745 [Pseudomonadota bacterium]
MAEAGKLSEMKGDAAYYSGKVLRILAFIFVIIVAVIGTFMVATWQEALWPIRWRVENMWQVAFGNMLDGPCWDARHRHLCDEQGKLKHTWHVQQNSMHSATARQICRVEPGLAALCELHDLYPYFNRHLFDGELPDVIISLRCMHGGLVRIHRTQFVERGGAKVPMIIIDPHDFKHRSSLRVASVLVREMIQVKVALDNGSIERTGHGSAFAAKMKLAGLRTTSTGLDSGKPTGTFVGHIIIKGGTFWQVAMRHPLIAKNTLSLADQRPQRMTAS